MKCLPFSVSGAVAACLVLAACGGDDGGEAGADTEAATVGTGSTPTGGGADDDGDNDDGQSMMTTTGPDPDSGTTNGTVTEGQTDTGESATDTSDDTGMTDDTGGGGLCGNSVVDEGEGCDMPNGVDADGCNEDCTISGAVLWSHTQAGGLGLEEDLFGIAVDEESNAYVSGAFNNDVTGTDFWVRQYTADGGLGWTVSIAGSAMAGDSALAIVRYDEAVYVAGTLNTTGASNNWRVQEYTLDGGAGWNASYNGVLGGADVAESVAADTLGNVYVVGRQTVELQSRNIYVQQHLSGGMVGWTAGYSGAALGDDRALAVATDPTGNVIVVGFETVTGQGRDGWIRKYDAAGAVLWTEGYQGLAALNDQAEAVVTDAAGNVFVAGSEGTMAQGAVAWVRRYDPEGVEAWTQPWSGLTAEGASMLGVALDGAGHLVAVGTETVAGVQQGLVRKYDAAGNVLWSETYGEGETARVRAVTIGPGDRIWIAGGRDLGIDGRDTWVARLAQ